MLIKILWLVWRYFIVKKNQDYRKDMSLFTVRLWWRSCLTVIGILNIKIMIIFQQPRCQLTKERHIFQNLKGMIKQAIALTQHLTLNT